MARVEGSCHRCGRWVKMEKVGNRRDADWRSANRTFTCEECKEILRREKSAAALAWGRAHGLEDLEGTEAQIDWAATIRQDILTRVRADIDRVDLDRAEASALEIFYLTGKDRPWDRLLQALAWLEHQVSAHWWIEHRTRPAVDLVRDIALTNVVLPDEADELEAEAALQQAALDSTTILPPEGIALLSPLPVEIRILDSQIHAVFPDLLEAFRELVKSLSYSWSKDRRVWYRVITEMSAPLTDRAVELASKLLQAGFKVTIQDSTVRARALTGEYTPEHTRWVFRMGEGQYRGWLAFHWARSEDFYQRAKRLSGSRYDKPHVVVPPAAWESVQDFAGLYDFRITSSARDVIEKAQNDEKASRLAKLGKKLEKSAKKDGLKELLEVPPTVEIPDDLRD